MADPWARPDPQFSTLASSWVTQAGSACLPAEPAPRLPASLTALCGSQWTVLSIPSNQWHQDSAPVLPSAPKIFSPGFTWNLGDKPIIPLAERPQWDHPLMPTSGFLIGESIYWGSAMCKALCARAGVQTWIKTWTEGQLQAHNHVLLSARAEQSRGVLFAW